MLNSLMYTHSFFFFYNDTATTEIYTLSLHDALPIYAQEQRNAAKNVYRSVEHDQKTGLTTFGQFHQHHSQMRSEERFSRNAETDLVCRLLLEKKKKIQSSIKKTCQKTEKNNTLMNYE